MSQHLLFVHIWHFMLLQPQIGPSCPASYKQTSNIKTERQREEQKKQTQNPEIDVNSWLNWIEFITPVAQVGINKSCTFFIRMAVMAIEFIWLIRHLCLGICLLRWIRFYFPIQRSRSIRSTFCVNREINLFLIKSKWEWETKPIRLKLCK